MNSVTPVLLAGGSGKRLWPLSRKSYPKQFSNLVGSNSLFQQSARRLVSSKKLKFKSHITITNSDFRFIVGEQLHAVGIDPGPILIEPDGKNTAPAILAASFFAFDQDPEAILLVAPSDHVIPDTKRFHDAVCLGLDKVFTGNFVTFGISPTHSETGYGYLKLVQDTNENGIFSVSQFIEKPDFALAEEMFKAGNYLWNSGIFLFKAVDMIAAAETYAPEIMRLAKSAMMGAKPDLGFLRLDSGPWSKINSISIDYAIMEKAKNVVAVPYSSGWSDLGGWDAVWAQTDKDSSGNATSERAYSIDCLNTLLRSENPSQQIVGLGLDNIVAIAMSDAVLVANKDRAQDVKKAVNLLKHNNISQAEFFPKDHRPWGWFESLILEESFQVKRICVNPGGSLSLQSHKYRSEHWIVVEGKAKVTIDDNVQLVSEGQSVYVPLGAVHRMENPGELPMFLIEVQIGSYLGEDDIVRYEDVYSRD